MIHSNVTIINKLGLHARAAAKFVNTASQFNSHVDIIKNDQKVNGKSILGVMMLAANKGTTLRLEATGDDAEDTLEALKDLIARRFDEEE